MLSIVIPTDPEEKDALFSKTLENLKSDLDIEIIYISKAMAPSRAERMNLGFQRSKGQIVLFHHPRSFIEKEGIYYLEQWSKQKRKPYFWGGFTHRFDRSHFLLKFTSWYSNEIRFKRKGIVYLDHCIFFSREIWSKDLPPWKIFEDTVLSSFFLEKSKPVLLNFVSTTSSIRFTKNGILYQLILNSIMKILFYLGVSNARINALYEKGLSLN
jgi:hypothetical protein